MRIVITFILILNAWALHASDANGVIFGTVREAQTGKEISGATVKLLLVNQTCPQKEILSDEQGQFLFNGLRLGRYRVNVTKDGYVRAVYGESTDHPIGQELLITGATSQHEIDFQLGTSAAVSGHIYDSEGKAVADSPVAFESIVDHQTFRTFTDSVGYFFLADLPSDLYKISARKYDSSKNQIESERWYYPGTLDGDVVEAVELKPGKTAVIDIRFGRAPKPVWTAKVIGAEGEAISKADIGLMRFQDSKMNPTGGCRTGKDGTCFVRNLEPGIYWVYLLAVPAPYATWFVDDPAIESMEMFAKKLFIESGTESTTEFQVKKGVPIRAKIYMGSGAPAAIETGIQVTLTHFWQVSHFKLPLRAAATHPAADTLEFFVHPALSYELEINHQDPSSNFSVVKVEWKRMPLSNPVQISTNSEELIEIFVDQSSTISGLAPGAKIIFAERISDRKEDFYSSSLFHASVQQGNFLLRALPPGTYRIRQDKKNGPFVEVSVVAGESKTIALK